MMFLFSLAFAGGVHAGIPVHGVPGLGEPTFQSPAAGWTAPIAGGFVRVFVGATEAEAAEWFARARVSIQVPPPDQRGIGDAGFGDGETLYAFVDGNVAVLIRASADADTWAATLHNAIVDGVPWPATPQLQAQPDGRWSVVERGVFVSGASQVPFQPGVFQTPPAEIVVWDAYGRPAILRAATPPAP